MDCEDQPNSESFKSETDHLEDRKRHKQRRKETRRDDLPPPPCRRSSRSKVHDLNIPLPPAIFQPPVTKSNKQGEDPFLAAYKVCTRSDSLKKSRFPGGVKIDVGSDVKKLMRSLSCKSSCSVVVNDVVTNNICKLRSEKIGSRVSSIVTGLSDSPFIPFSREIIQKCGSQGKVHPRTGPFMSERFRKKM